MANPINEVFAEVLLDRIRNDTYPSSTHMDMFEAVAPPRQLGEYLSLLMERIEADQHPSISLMRRVQRLANRFG
jgi:hypothetical protein